MIHYVVGDATEPKIDGNKIITHCCNDRGVWGSGFVLAVSNKWPETKTEYVRYIKEREGKGLPSLGSTQFIKVKPDITIANIIGQVFDGSYPHIRYGALEAGFRDINEYAKALNATIHAPRLGSARAGGSWDLIEDLMIKNISVDIYVYDLPNTLYSFR